MECSVTMLAASALLTGLILGLRYRVFILPPVTLLGGLVIYATSSQGLLSIFLFAVLLQMGYLGAALLKKRPEPSAGEAVRALHPTPDVS